MAEFSCPLNDFWCFTRNMTHEMTAPGYDDSGWDVVDLPHDWCVEQPFDPNAGGHCRNAWLAQGTGCYRKTVAADPAMRGLVPFLRIGGIAGISEVWVNGVRVGGEEWAFAPVEADLSGCWNEAGENVIAVTVDQSHTPVCRWYEGAGIYREAVLEYRSPKAVIPENGVFVRTESTGAPGGPAVVSVEYHLKNMLPERIRMMLRQEIIAPGGAVVFSDERPHTVPAGMRVSMTRRFDIPSPRLWSPDDPALYTFRSVLFYDGAETDRSEVRFGIRLAVFDRDRGFLLNGKEWKLNGVCLHNDLGALGSACTGKGVRRQLEILKGMGANAVRTAHNPFGTCFLDACDEVGMLVLAEIFDEWQEPQRVAPVSDGEFQSMQVNYYHHLFDRRAARDLTREVERSRNHPSIILWSIGNEVKQMYKFSGGNIAGYLQELAHNADPSRPVTCAVVVGNISTKNVGVLDVGGYNYPSAAQLDEFHAANPDQPMVVTECFSAQTRRPLGEYYPAGKLPELGYAYPEALRYVSWFEHFEQGYEAWKAAAERPFAAGIFIWTGFDYLGEPTPYDFPSHSSYFGVADLCGFPKDGYYFYRSVWRPEALVHLATAWDFKPGDECEVQVLTNCDSGAVYLNGRRIGGWTEKTWIYRVTVPFEPGELRVEGRRGGETAEDSVFTSGTPAEIRLTPYFNAGLMADGHDMEFVACELFDAAGHRVRNAAVPVKFDVSGAGRLEALDNGLQTSMEPFRGTDVRHTCAGRCLAVVRAGRQPGTLTVRASAPQAGTAVLEIPVR